MPENKVRFGLKNVHAGLYTETTAGAVTLGTPMAVPGAVRMNLEPNSEEVVFYADDIRYYVTYSDDGFNGELEMALFSDEFKLIFMKTWISKPTIRRISGTLSSGSAKRETERRWRRLTKKSTR